MLKFFFLSLVLHVVVFWGLTHFSRAPLEEPIVSVSLDFSHPLQPSQPSPKTATPSPTPLKSSAPTLKGTDTAETPPPPPESASALAFESGNVSVKPRVMRQVEISYPPQAKEARVEGAVKLSVLIDDSGHVREVKVLEGPGYGLDEAAKTALEQFLFSPAEVQGQKVPVRIVYVYRFRLESR